MRRIVTVILDGLRRDFVRSETTPNLARLKERSTWFSAHRSAVPSVTRVCSASFATGSYAARHGLEGNSLALLENDRLVIHDAGHPDFLQHRRRVTGKSLIVPTLAERIAEFGGAVTFSNVSPGAAYAHDPDGHGFVYHRTGSYGPGRDPVPEGAALNVGSDVAGDRAMTQRFIKEALTDRRPALSLLWLGHPDTMQHEVPLGSPEHLQVLRGADDHVGLVIDRVNLLRADKEDVLLIVGSDHGHQTVHAVIDVQAEIEAIGFADALAAGDLVVVPNGTAVLIYASPAGRRHVPALAERLRDQTWAGPVFAGEALGDIGQSDARGLALFVSMAFDEETNEFGVPGRSYAAKPLAGKPDRLGCGQHGGLGTYEQSPFLMIDGEGFAPGASRPRPCSLIDIAPTILTHLGLPTDGSDGRPLQTTT